MRRTVGVTVTIILIMSVILTSFNVSAVLDSETAPDLNADAAILININTDEVLFEKNSNLTVYPASSVKIMTAIVVIENVDDLDAVVTADKASIKASLGNNISIVEGEELTVRQLLFALLAGTANDAANVLATYVAGDIQSFVAMMNDKAKVLGAENTVYTNPTGMHDPNMVTTAHDTALISKYACCNSTLTSMASTQTYVIEKTNKKDRRTLYNKNLFITENTSYYYKNAKGLNSGSTEQAGYNLVTMATDKGIPLLCVVLSCDKTNDGVVHSYVDSKNLYEWAFGSYNYVTVLKARQVSYEMPVKLSAQTDYVLLYPDKDIELLLPVNINVNEDIQKAFSLKSDYLEAPVSKNTIVGEVVLLYNDEILATANLLTSDDVERSDILYFLKRIDDAIHTTWFKTSFVSFIILTLIYLVTGFIHKKRHANDDFLRRRR